MGDDVVRSLTAGLLLGALPGCFPTATPSATPLDPERKPVTASAARRPFIVNWAPTDRTALETRAQQGPLVMAARGDVLELLPRCRVAGGYEYFGASHASQSLAITTAADLGIKFPFAGPVNLGATLEKYGQLVVEYHTVGEYRGDFDVVSAAELSGDCSGASHVVAGLSVGAFEFFAGDKIGGRVDASVPGMAGGGGGAERSYEHLDRGGDKAACEHASKKDLEPAERCDTIIAIELLRIDRELPLVAGDAWEGSYECADRRTTSRLEIVEVRGERDVTARLHFDDGQAQGVFLSRGRYDVDSGGLALDFAEWEQQPEGYVPVNPQGVISVEGDVYEGGFRERACGEFEYRRVKVSL